MKRLFILALILPLFASCKEDKDATEQISDIEMDDRFEGTKWISSDLGSNPYGFYTTKSRAYAEFSKGYVYISISGRKSSGDTSINVAKCKYHVDGETIIFKDLEQEDAIFDIIGLSALTRRGNNKFLKNLKKK